MRPFSAVGLAAGVAASTNFVAAQTEDTVWHNRYHAVLAMALYSDEWETRCPQQTFTEASMRRSFPNTDLAPFEVIERFNTTSGAVGATIQIPEMDKVVLVFRGDFAIEADLSPNVTSWDILGLGSACPGCTVNARAAQAYVEAREATNNWELSRARVEETGLQYSIAGHGFGGMLSLVASVDLGWAGVCRWSHNHGAPRVFNQAGADFYNRLYQGEAGERGVARNDQFVNIFPASEDYAFTNSAFHYGEYDNVTHMAMTDCYDEPNDPACAPHGDADPLESHYFYFVQPGQCGGQNRPNASVIEPFVSSLTSEFFATATIDAAAFSTSLGANITTRAANATSTMMTSTTSSASASSTIAPSLTRATSSVTNGIAGAANAVSSTTGISGATPEMTVLPMAAVLIAFSAFFVLA